jgi:Icc protein
MADRDDKDLIGAAKMNRRGLLKCMAWTGTGVVWTLSGGVPRTLGLMGGAAAAEAPQGALTFVQISDSHIGFHLPPNPDPSATLTEAINKIKAMPAQPAFLIHTGDISHLSKEEQWDDADQIIKSANKQVFFLPGEHDVADADNGKAYLARYGKNTKGKGWYSFDHGGVHFIGLINVFEFQPGFKSAGLAKIGDEQLEWLEKDVKGLSASTPIVLMAHLPLWTIYEQRGWGTQDAGRALGYVNGVPPPGFSILRKSAVCGPRRGGQRSGAAARRSRASPRFPGLSRQYACRQDRFVPYRVDDLRHASDPTRRNGMARRSPPIVQ